MPEQTTFKRGLGIEIEWRDDTAKSLVSEQTETGLKRYGFVLGKSRKAGLHITVSAGAKQRVTLYIDGKKAKAWAGSRSGNNRTKDLHNSLSEYPGAKRLDFTFEHQVAGKWKSSDRVRVGRGRIAGSVYYRISYDDALSSDKDYNDAVVVATLPPY